MNIPDPLPGKISALRRSQRVCLSVPVTVMREGLGKNVTSEDTRTLIVSAHGALIILGLSVETGQLLTLKHFKTQEQLVCRVIHLGPEQSGKREVGIEFEKPSPRFWRIAFPPADWSPRSVDARPPTAQPVAGRPPLNKN
ncbi:MAG TPA: PilZ domain-containing protein, partial [Candidatus Acidoferrum sp.]|nr:PilZ domain-containing protein [Candidatus Acidoferrum sp.]